MQKFQVCAELEQEILITCIFQIKSGRVGSAAVIAIAEEDPEVVFQHKDVHGLFHLKETTNILFSVPSRLLSFRTHLLVPHSKLRDFEPIHDQAIRYVVFFPSLPLLLGLFHDLLFHMFIELFFPALGITTPIYLNS